MYAVYLMLGTHATLIKSLLGFVSYLSAESCGYLAPYPQDCSNQTWSEAQCTAVYICCLTFQKSCVKSISTTGDRAGILVLYVRTLAPGPPMWCTFLPALNCGYVSKPSSLMSSKMCVWVLKEKERHSCSSSFWQCSMVYSCYDTQQTLIHKSIWV